MSYTHLKPGSELEVCERAYFYSDSEDISALTTFSPEELVQMEQSSIEREEAIYSKLLTVVKEWKEQGKKTVQVRKACEYLKVAKTPHTENRWTEDQYGNHEMSNMVYKFTWRAYERTYWDSNAQKSITVAWVLSWHLNYNTPPNPDYSGKGWKIAGQSQKVFKDKPSMEKYLRGRIAAYIHLFTEVSPPIPKADQKRFCVNGVLLPGYTVETPVRTEPDEAAVDDLLECLFEEDITVERSPEEIWNKNRDQKHRHAHSKRETAPTR